MPKIIIFSILFSSIILSNCLAETSIKSDVNKQALSTDEALNYKVIVTSTENEVPTPEIPPFEDFLVLYKLQSTTINFVKNAVKKTIIFAFTLRPKKEGLLQIKPSSIKINDEIFKTETLKIKVTKGKLAVPKGAPPTLEKKEKPQQKIPQSTSQEANQVVL